CPGGSSSIVAGSGFTAIGSHLFFAANDGTSGVEPWSSDGTSAGTVRLADVFPGSTGSSAGPFVGSQFGTAYFAATSDTLGRELWKSDGTPGGTALGKDPTTGTAQSLAPAPFGQLLRT